MALSRSPYLYKPVSLATDCMMKIKTPRFNSLGSIDCEIEHPQFGWIPFTASPDDNTELGRSLYAALMTGEHGEIPAFQPHQPTATELCALIDSAADAARMSVVADPTRTLEYQLAAVEAQAFADAGYPAAAVPRTVSADMLGGRSAREAADNILAEAKAYNWALYAIRETRLRAKEEVRQASAAGEIEQAKITATEAIAAIQAAVSGVGNAAG